VPARRALTLERPGISRDNEFKVDAATEVTSRYEAGMDKAITSELNPNIATHRSITFDKPSLSRRSERSSASGPTGARMNIASASSAALSTSAATVSAPAASRQRASLDDDAPALREKTTTLHRRRQRARLMSHAGKTERESSDAVVLTTADGAIAFTMRRSPLGLVVERTQRQTLGAQLVQAMLFEDLEAFARWHDQEPVRFDDPVLYDRLRRQGDDAFGSKR
jgi:hypothetical protein